MYTRRHQYIKPVIMPATVDDFYVYVYISLKFLT